MMKNDLLSKIEKNYSSMSKGQKSIANYILGNYDKAAFMTACRLGEVTNVSESTVVRFAMSLGFKGYPEFQSELRELVRIKLTSVQRLEITDGLIKGDVLESVLTSDIQRIRSTLDSIDRIAFSDAAEKIANASHVYIIGMRSSSFLASFLAYNFRYMFDNVTVVQTTSGSEVFESLLRVGENDVVIAISFPRYSKRMITAVEFAKKQNAYVVAITDGNMSPIAQDADARLYAKSDMTSFADSLVAPLCIIDALIASVANKKRAVLSDVFGRLEKIWDEYDVYDKDSK